MAKTRIRPCTGFAHPLDGRHIPGCGRTIDGVEVPRVRGRIKGDICLDCHTTWRDGVLERLMQSPRIPDGLFWQTDKDSSKLTRLLMYEYDPMLYRCESMVRQARTRLVRRGRYYKGHSLLDGLSGTDAAWKLYEMAPTHCPYLEVELDPTFYGDRKAGAAGARPNSPSLDRIDSSRGYHWDNVQVISFLANRIKTDATPEQMVTFARNALRIHGHRPGKRL